MQVLFASISKINQSLNMGCGLKKRVEILLKIFKTFSHNYKAILSSHASESLKPETIRIQDYGTRLTD